MNQNTYWNSNGTHQELIKKLYSMIPVTGTVYDAKKNVRLEKFRKAMNVYYDVYNNGLGNRASMFKGCFGFASGQYKYPYGYGRAFDQQLYNRMEAEMDNIVYLAAQEQGINYE